MATEQEAREAAAYAAAIEAFVKTFASKLGFGDDEDAIEPLAGTSHEHRSLALNQTHRTGILVTVRIEFSRIVNVADLVKAGPAPKA